MTDPHLSRSAADWARDYLQRGWQPVPIPKGSKGPNIKGWQNLVVTPENLEKHFPGGPQNIGIRLGPRSGGLVDVDLDCPEAVTLAPSFLPNTATIFGRQSKPRSHYFFTIGAETTTKATVQFKDEKKAMIVELRTGGGDKGAQTLAPGSVHPNGEAVRWDSDGLPAEGSFGVLTAAVTKIAVGVMILRHYPPEGIKARHGAAQVLGGFLARVGWDRETIEDFVEAIARAANDPEISDRRKAASDAAEAHGRGENTYGFPALEEYLGKEAAGQIAKTLGHREHGNGQVREGWRAQCQATKSGEPLPNLFNVMLALRGDGAVRDIFSYDEMACSAIVRGAIPGQIAGGHYPRTIIDEDVSSLQHWLQSSGLRNVGRDVVHQAVNMRAREKCFHPVRDYLDALQWDGERRTYDFLPRYFGAENTLYTRKIGRLFLIGMVARIYQPGCKADYMLIIEGDQGRMKSSACEALAGEWFSDQLPDLSHKDSSQHLRGKWLVEIAELHTFSRAETEMLKSYLTRRTERYRPPYGHHEVSEPRQTIFIGSSNREQYLGDVSGARRFWPFKALNIDLEGLKRDRDQLFAEAVALYRAGVWWWPTRDFEREYAQKAQDARYDTDIWEGPIVEYLNLQVTGGRRAVLINEVAKNALGFDTDARIGTADHNRIKKMMTRLGWVRDQKRDRRGLYPYRPGPGWRDPAPGLKLVGSDHDVVM